MTLLFFPTFGCNMACLYCFQRPRLKRPLYQADRERIELEKIEKALEMLQSSYGQIFDEIGFHGGEPTSIPLDVLEKLFDFFKGKGLKISMQSNCYMITDEHIKLFKKYNVRVGASVDGFPDINLLRGFFDENGNEFPASKKYRVKVVENLRKLKDEKILYGVIIILHKLNAGEDQKISRLIEFLKWLKEIGVIEGRLNHMYPTYPTAEKYALTNDELFYAYVRLYEATKQLKLSYSPFTDIQRALMGSRDVVCWFSGCHYYDSLVWAITYDGRILSCDRMLENSPIPRPSTLPHTDMFYLQPRTIALLQTELKDDKYAHLHRGGCPAEAEDWRKPSKYVKAFSRLFEYIEQDIKKTMPNVRLASDYPNKFEYIRLLDSGRKYDIFKGCFV